MHPVRQTPVKNVNDAVDNTSTSAMMLDTLQATHKMDVIPAESSPPPRDVCKCKVNDRPQSDSWFQKQQTPLNKCKRCCGPDRITISKLLKLCEQDPDCIINMYKRSSGSDKCLPDLIIENDAFVQADVKHGANKYHYLMKDDATNYETPVRERTDSMFVCKKIKAEANEYTYVCKKIQTEEEPQVMMEVAEQSKHDISTITEVPNVFTTGERNDSLQSNNLSVLNYVIKQQQPTSDITIKGSMLTEEAAERTTKCAGIFRYCRCIRDWWRKRRSDKQKTKGVDEQVVKVVYVTDDNKR